MCLWTTHRRMKTPKSPSKPNTLKTSVVVLKLQVVLRVVTHACNPSTWGLRAGLSYLWRPCLTKQSQQAKDRWYAGWTPLYYKGLVAQKTITWSQSPEQTRWPEKVALSFVSASVACPHLLCTRVWLWCWKPRRGRWGFPWLALTERAG